MTAGQHIDYEALAQDAMRGVVRAVLQQVAASGLVGSHHFYIAFNTQAAGASISRRLKEKYPEEMTIVLQHRFWDLEVSEDRFEVKLTFDGVPERLVVPFRAVKVFYDPSVPYGLQFEESALMSEASRRPGIPRHREEGENDAVGTGSPPKVPAGADKRREPRVPRRVKSDAKPDVPVPAPVVVAAGRAAAPSAADTDVESTKPEPLANTDGPAKSGPPGANVVDLSKFRKK